MNNLEETFRYDNLNRLTEIRLGGVSTVMEERVGNTLRTKRYVGSCEFVTLTGPSGTQAKSLTFLTGPTGVYAVVVTEDNVNTVHYVLKDNLGSWTAITDSEGNLEQRLSYDAWGNLRYPRTWENYPIGEPFVQPLFDRGFTGHEHLWNFGLINMNGRMYDPLMSSFLSADRFVQNPETAQGFNRYAYCMHNPLRYVDPSGWEMRKPVPGRTPNTSDFYMDPHAFAERALEPRDLGILQLPTSDPSVVWMEENEMHGVGGEEDSVESSPVALGENPPEGTEVHTGEDLGLKAYWHYQFGGGEDYWVDAATLNLDYISQDDLTYHKNGTATINLFDHSKTDEIAITLGQIILIPKGNNQFEIDKDTYDFNIEWNRIWTCYFQPSKYWGGSFKFHFSNTVYIKP